jgi:A/G-specific adenine glycosylase
VIIQNQHGGKLPRRAEALEKLPGIGEYTAAAIAAFAHREDAVALDGNLRRVISRQLNLELDPRSPAGKRTVMDWAERHLPGGKAADFNQALMDLGALICAVRNPQCEACPIRASCLARLHGTQQSRPIRSAAKHTPIKEQGAAVLWRGDSVLIQRRAEDGLLGGMWQFPEADWLEGEYGLQAVLEDRLGVSLVMTKMHEPIQHAYTHFRVCLHTIEFNLVEGDPMVELEMQWVRPMELRRYPMGKLARQISELLR